MTQDRSPPAAQAKPGWAGNRDQWAQGEGAQVGPLHSFLPYFPFPHPLSCPMGLAPQYFKDSGIPEKELGRLGELSRLYTEQEISQWSVNSSETLSALLSPSGGDWNDSQVNPWQQKGMGDEELKLQLKVETL